MGQVQAQGRQDRGRVETRAARNYSTPITIIVLRCDAGADTFFEILKGG